MTGSAQILIGDVRDVRLASARAHLEQTGTEIIEGLDPGIGPVVTLLRSAGIETFESCQGGMGHTFNVPTVRFHGMRDEGFRALAVLIRQGLPVDSLRRYWTIIDGEPTGPDWEITLWRLP